MEPWSPWTIEQFTWTIKNFSKCDSQMYSESFFMSGYPWQIVMNPKGNENNSGYLSLSILSVVADIIDFSKDWKRYVNLELALTNQANALLTIVKETEQEFNASNYCWSVDKFIHLDELRNPWNAFIVNDTCIIKAWIISVSEHGYERLINQEVSKMDSPAQPISVKEISLVPSCINLCVNLVDFRGLGKVDKKFVPLLDEACSWHPSLLGKVDNNFVPLIEEACPWHRSHVDNQRKRKHTRRFTEWALTALLGRVLHFLHTKRVKDMNEEACNHLQILWEELETVGFDLSWLKPYIESAIGKKSYAQRYADVKRLRKTVEALESDHAKAREELIEAEKEFVERDLDAKLGYGAVMLLSVA